MHASRVTKTVPSYIRPISSTMDGIPHDTCVLLGTYIYSPHFQHQKRPVMKVAMQSPVQPGTLQSTLDSTTPVT